MTDLLSLTPPELAAYLQTLGEPAYRARQLFAWLQRGRAFAQMTNLPGGLRKRLTEVAIPCGVSIDAVRTSQRDDTRKFLFGMLDGQQVEGVLMRYRFGNTLCISTQVGCRMGCAFCASTLEGLVRNLMAGEILGQVVRVERLLEEEAREAKEAGAETADVPEGAREAWTAAADASGDATEAQAAMARVPENGRPAAIHAPDEAWEAGIATAPASEGATEARPASAHAPGPPSAGNAPPARYITNVVLMGSGEPLDNYDETVKFIRLIGQEGGMNMSPRNISVSTCGLVEGIDRLREEGLPLTLCISLHAPNDGIRRQIMPIANAVSIAELLDACRRWTQATGRRVIFEYALIDGVNDALNHADELSRRLRGLSAHVNLIPLNPVPERSLAGTKDRTARDFCARLEHNGISATIRREMGTDIEGACGQLRRKARKDREARP